jgi:hypothetical protein
MLTISTIKCEVKVCCHVLTLKNNTNCQAWAGSVAKRKPHHFFLMFTLDVFRILSRAPTSIRSRSFSHTFPSIYSGSLRRDRPISKYYGTTRGNIVVVFFF